MAERRGTFTALHNRDFALLWFGQTVSSLGDGIYTIAVIIETLKVDPHPTGLALVIAARIVPSICFALLGGVVADRVPKRFAMLSADVARGAAVGVIATLVATHHIDVWTLAGMSIVFGIGDSFFNPAAMAMVPEILPEDLLVQGNALSSTTGTLASNLIGPAAGGVIVGFISVAGSFAFDAASFLVSVISLALMATHFTPAPTGKSKLEEAKEGLSYIRRQPWLLITLVAASIANFFGIAPLEVLLSLLVRHVLHASALTLGLVLAAGGATGITASLVVARIGRPRREITVMWTAYSLSGIAIVALAFSPDPVVAAVLSAVEVGLIVYGDVLYVSMMQRLVPADKRGRVFSTAFLLAFVLTPLGTLAGGVAAAAFGTRTAIVLSGLLSGGACVSVLFIPAALAPDREPPPADSKRDEEAAAGHGH